MASADGQIVLEEEIDENYEPTEQEVLEYAAWLGMDVDKEKDLLWVAREGLKAPLPENWKPCKTPAGDIYYFDFGSGESIWDHPCDEFYRKLYQEEKKKRSMMQPSGGSLSGGLGSKTKGPSPLGNGQQKSKTIRMSSPSQSLNNSFDALPDAPKANPKPLGALKPLGSSLDNSGGLAPLKQLSPLSGSGSDWKTGPGGHGGGAANQGRRATQDNLSLSRSLDEEEDRESREQFRRQLEKERLAWERRAQADFEEEGEEIERAHRKKLAQMREDYEEEEATQKRKMRDNCDSIMAEYKKQMEAREAREKEEMLVSLKRKIADWEEEHRGELASLKQQHEEAEEALRRKVDASRQALDEADILDDSEVADAKNAARSRALAQIEKECEESVQQERAAIRQTKMDAAMAEIDAEVAELKATMKMDAVDTASLGEKRKDLEEIEAEIKSKKKVLDEMEAQVANKSAAAAAFQETQNQVAGLAADVRAKQRELDDISSQLADKVAEFEELSVRLRDKRAESADLDLDIKEKKVKVRDLKFELQEVEAKLASGSSQACSAPQSHGPTSAEAAVTEAALVAAKKELDEAKRSLLSVEADVMSKKGELEAIASEMGRQQAVALARETAMTQEARAKAIGELSAAEEELHRAKSELSRLNSQLSQVKVDLAATSIELEQTRTILARINDELAEKQGQKVKLNSEVAAETAALSELERRLRDGRSQLDQLAATLESTKREAQEAAHKSFDLEVASQKRALLDERMAAMVREVDSAVAAERAKNEAAAKAAAAAAQQYHQTAASAALCPPPEDEEAHHQHGMPPPTSALSPRIPATNMSSINPLLLAGGSEDDTNDHHLPKHTSHGHLTPVNETPRESVVTLNDLKGDQRTADLTRSTNRLQKSLEMLLKQPGGVLGPVGGIMHSQQRSNNASYPRYRSAGPSRGHAAFSEDDDAFSVGAGGSRAWGNSSSPYESYDRIVDDVSQSYPGFDLQNPAMLSKAKSFLRHQKRSIKERQSMIQNARDDWKVSMSAVEICPDPAVRSRQAALLKQVKDVLEDQAHRLNADASQLRNLKLKIKTLESRNNSNSRNSMRSSAAPLHYQSDGNRSAATHLAYQSDGNMHRYSAQMMRERGQEEQTASAAAAALAAVLPLLKQQALQQQSGGQGGDGREYSSPQSAHSGDSIFRSSLEKISQAVNEALAASSQSHQVRASFPQGSSPSDGGGSSARYSAAAHSQSQARRNGGIPRPAWASANEEGIRTLASTSPGDPHRRNSFSYSIDAQAPPSFASLGQTDMDGSRSTWPPQGSRGQPMGDWPRGAPQYDDSHRLAAGSSQGYPFSSGGAQPMTLDIGGGQQIVIAVRPK